MPNAKITAAFADRRTYVYNGKPIDQQDHLGFDMASVEHDSIQASNSGKVVLARFFGIYGNAVVIDHGYGLMSLYGHLSSIGVKEGADGAARPGVRPLRPDRPRRRRPPPLHDAPPGAAGHRRSSGGTRTGSRTGSPGSSGRRCPYKGRRGRVSSGLGTAAPRAEKLPGGAPEIPPVGLVEVAVGALPAAELRGVEVAAAVAHHRRHVRVGSSSW